MSASSKADPGQDPVSTTVTDEPGSGTRAGNEGDLVKVTITADQTSVAENVKPTFTVHINQPLDHDLVVTLSNNARHHQGRRHQRAVRARGAGR
jgi:hypothetical protein